jgi:hypothetical protein
MLSSVKVIEQEGELGELAELDWEKLARPGYGKAELDELAGLGELAG